MTVTAPNPHQPLDPNFDLVIGGESLGTVLAGSMRRLSIDDDQALPSMFDAEIEGADPKHNALPTLVDDARVKPGASVEVKLGYGRDLDRVFIGELSAIEPEFDSSRPPRLRLRGYDARQRLQRGVRLRTFTAVTDSDVARQIGREAGLAVEAPDGGRTHDYLVQANQSDLAFLSDRAQAIGFETLLRDGKLLFRPVGFDAAEVATLALGEDLLSFSASFTLAQQVSEVEVRGWSVKDKAAIRARAATGDERTVMTGSSSADWVGKAYRATSADRTGSQPIFDQSDADAFARARFNDASLALVTGEGRMLGRPELRAGSVVKITGAGQRFSGAYYLTNVSHTYRAQGGYMTTFTGRRNAL